jgi:hypothetical protein
MIHILIVIPAKEDPVWFTLHTALTVAVQVMTALVSVLHVSEDSPKSFSRQRRIMGIRDQSDGLVAVIVTRCWVCGCRRDKRTCHQCYGS